MTKLTHHMIRTTIGLILCVQLLPNSIAGTNRHSADRSVEARQSQEDTSSPQDYYQTLKKEAGAALQINLRECKSMKSKSRAHCEREAREVYKQDLIDAKQKAQEMRQ